VQHAEFGIEIFAYPVERNRLPTESLTMDDVIAYQDTEMFHGNMPAQV
jgi:hypothetical protein